MIPVETGILIVPLKFQRGACSTVYLFMNGVILYFQHDEHNVPLKV